MMRGLTGNHRADCDVGTAGFVAGVFAAERLDHAKVHAWSLSKTLRNQSCGSVSTGAVDADCKGRELR